MYVCASVATRRRSARPAITAAQRAIAARRAVTRPRKELRRAIPLVVVTGVQRSSPTKCVGKGEQEYAIVIKNFFKRTKRSLLFFL